MLVCTESVTVDGDFRGDREPTAFHLDQKFAPALRTFPDADLEADELLLALRRRADQHQHALAVIFHAGLQKDTVGPDVDVSSRRQIALLPALVLALPLGRQPGNHRR